MTHEEIKILISVYTDGEVTPSEKIIVEGHLKDCLSCQQEYKMYRAMSSSLSKWSNESLSPDEEIKVQKQFEQRRESMFTKRTVVTFATTLCLSIIVGSVVHFQIQKGAVEANSIKNMPIAAKAANLVSGIQYEPYYSQTNYDSTVANSRLGAVLTEANVGRSFINPIIHERIGIQTTTYSNPTAMLADNASLGGAGIINGDNINNYWRNPLYPIFNEAYRYQDAASNTEQYDRIYDNIFLEVKDNPLSTFSINVDTGSYSNVRRYLLNGQMPPKDAVHIEEMINYFHYDYPQPKWNEPFSITTEMTPCPWNRAHHLVLVGLQGKKIPMDNLPASNLVFLVDVSGSMGDDNKLSLVKASLHLLVEQLRPKDTISIAVFSGSAARLLDPTSGRDKDKIENAIDSLEAGGSTNGEEGLQLAYKIAKENFIPNGNNRIIVTTDGDFNVGTSDDADLIRMIEEKRDQGIYLSVFGFGMGNLKASRMEKLADSGHGNYDYIDSLDEARKEFVQQLGGTLYAIAKDVKIQVEFNPANVKAYRLIGYEKGLLNKEDFNNDKKDAGVIGSGHTVTALYEIVPASSMEKFNEVDALKYQTSASINDAASDEVMTVKLRYKEPKSQDDKSKLMVKVIKKDEISSPGSENIRFAASVAEFGMLLRDSTYKGTATYLGLMTEARLASGEDTEGYKGEFLQVVQKAGLLSPDTKTQDSSK